MIDPAKSATIPVKPATELLPTDYMLIMRECLRCAGTGKEKLADGQRIQCCVCLGASAVVFKIELGSLIPALDDMRGGPWRAAGIKDIALGEFVDSRCVLLAGHWTPSHHFYSAFVAWAKSNGYSELPGREVIGKSLGNVGFRSVVRRHEGAPTRGWLGIAIKAEDFP